MAAVGGLPVLRVDLPAAHPTFIDLASVSHFVDYPATNDCITLGAALTAAISTPFPSSDVLEDGAPVALIAVIDGKVGPRDLDSSACVLIYAPPSVERDRRGLFFLVKLALRNSKRNSKEKTLATRANNMKLTGGVPSLPVSLEVKSFVIE
jgi:hypothetical protein